MTNYIQPGDTLELVLTADVLAGNIVVAGSLAGVAVNTALSGETVAVKFEGVYDLLKGASTFAVGAKVYWDDTAKVVTSTSTSNSFVGYAAVAALTGDATATVLLSRLGS